MEGVGKERGTGSIRIRRYIGRDRLHESGGCLQLELTTPPASLGVFVHLHYSIDIAVV